MTVSYNPVRRSQIDQADGVAGLDSDGYLTNIGEIGHPPQINGDGAIEAIVSHRIDTVANLQALGALPEGEIAVVVNGSDVPIGFRVGDTAETAGGYPIATGVEIVTVESLTLTSTSLITIPGLSITLPANSLLEVSGALRFGTGSSLDYTFNFATPALGVLGVRDGSTTSQNVTGTAITMTGTGGAILLPPTIMKTTTEWPFLVQYQKISGASDKVLTRADLVYRVIG